MSSTPKQVNGSATTNGNLGKRKKTRSSKGSYLTKWLDKTMHHVPEVTPNLETYDYGGAGWQMNGQFSPGFDPCRLLYGCAEPASLPTLPTYYNGPVIGGFYGQEQRYQPARGAAGPRAQPRRRDKPEDVSGAPAATNGSFNKSYLQSKMFSDSQDYASLPPIVTSVADTNSNSDLYTNEKEEGGTNNRRYSDPCVQGLPDVAQPAKGEVDSGSEASSGLSGSQVGSRLLSCLLDQINTLKISNERLSKELQETRAELACVRQQNTIWQKSSSSSLGGTPNHSHLNNNGILGAGYSPGVLADLVREIRDAARLREEAVYCRVGAMLRERTENGISQDSKLSDRSLEDIKSSLRAAEADKRRMLERIGKLEDELTRVSRANGVEAKEGTPAAAAEDTEELTRLRKEVTDAKKAKVNAEEHALKLERLVTQLRSKFNGVQLSPSGPESLPSEPEHEANARVRRTSSSNNSTVVFGPVTDL
ncbi:unnamed protein product [Plutella xylostella]|uniref:(diamondback moth) hypothetical protein n=1 Tax=Plutella xylostella TaxID=51655 RepID=A0A8S4DSP7_PLUXY|nr:unnamed protein product [Plutella xylostella]